jgi:hypothetical protein
VLKRQKHILRKGCEMFTELKELLKDRAKQKHWDHIIPRLEDPVKDAAIHPMNDDVV